MTKLTSLKKTAYHEAGHAVAHHYLFLSFKYVSIIPDEQEGTLGHVQSKYPESFRPDFEISNRNRLRLEREIMACLAGHAAEIIYSGHENWVGASQDNHLAIHLALYVTKSNEEIEAFIKWMQIRTMELLKNPIKWLVVESVAEELLKNKRLKAKDVKRIISVVVKKKIGIDLEMPLKGT